MPPTSIIEDRPAEKLFAAGNFSPACLFVYLCPHSKSPDLNTAGFALVGGRLLPARSGPAAQFMYESKAGVRLTLYLDHNAGGRDTAFRFDRQEGVEAFYWLDGAFGYALVAEIPRDQLTALANLVYRQILD